MNWAMINIDDINNVIIIRFEMEYTYPTHKDIINELFNDSTLPDASCIRLDISSLKIIDETKLKSLLTGIRKLKRTGVEVLLKYTDAGQDEYISRLFELINFHKYSFG